jgi:dinuclear metal center YbgI/SA1388 family protein
MERTEIVKYLDAFFQIEKFKDESDANGLLIKGRPNVKKIGLAVNTSFNVVEECIKRNYDLLIVHHPSWKDNDLENYDKKMKILKQNGISLYAAHDCLDCNDKINTSKALAEELGITVKGKFARWDFLPWRAKRKYPNQKAYVGVHGIKETNAGGFLKLIEKKLKVKPKASIRRRKIRNIGIIAGGGLNSTWIREAKKLGCDTFLTGEGLFFGRLYGVESGINVILASHYATERPALARLAKKIKKVFNIDTQIIDDINYG